MTDSGIPKLERATFFDGQRLTASDLDAVQRYHRELRWLHNRSLHSWGIAFGYVVSGARGDRVVTLAPGLALDCQGRELILGEQQTLSVPAISGDDQGNPVTYYLTASYAANEDLEPQQRQGVCDTQGAVRYPETPVIRWLKPDEFIYGEDVILATISVKNCQLDDDVSGSSRRDAIPPQQPYISAGQSTPNQTLWRPWPDESNPVGLTTIVSTASAGFRATPRYQARIGGTRYVTGFQVDGEPRPPFVVEGHVQIEAATATNFQLRLILPHGVLPGTSTADITLNPSVIYRNEFLLHLQNVLGWHVVWVGIEG